MTGLHQLQTTRILKLVTYLVDYSQHQQENNDSKRMRKKIRPRTETATKMTVSLQQGGNSVKGGTGSYPMPSNGKAQVDCAEAMRHNLMDAKSHGTSTADYMTAWIQHDPPLIPCQRRHCYNLLKKYKNGQEVVEWGNAMSAAASWQQSTCQ